MIYMISNTNYLSISQSNKEGERRDEKKLKKEKLLFSLLRHADVFET